MGAFARPLRFRAVVAKALPALAGTKFHFEGPTASNNVWILTNISSDSARPLHHEGSKHSPHKIGQHRKTKCLDFMMQRQAQKTSFRINILGRYKDFHLILFGRYWSPTESKKIWLDGSRCAWDANLTQRDDVSCC